MKERHKELGSVDSEGLSGVWVLEQELEDEHRLLSHPVASVEGKAEEEVDELEGEAREKVLAEAADGLAQEVIFGAKAGLGEGGHDAVDRVLAFGLGNPGEIESEEDDGFGEFAGIHVVQAKREGNYEEVERSLLCSKKASRDSLDSMSRQVRKE
jgi:hypothetical protein